MSSNGASIASSSVINAAMRTGLTPLLTTAMMNASQVRPASWQRSVSLVLAPPHTIIRRQCVPPW